MIERLLRATHESAAAKELLFDLRTTWRRHGRFLLSLFLSVIIGSVATRGLATASLYAIEINIQRLFFTLRGPQTPPPQVVVVSLDAESNTKLGLPRGIALPRDVFASALEVIVATKPRLLVLDLRLEKMQGSALNDARIAAALRAVPSTIVGWPANAAGNREEMRSDELFRNAAGMELPMLLPYDEGSATLSRIAFPQPENKTLVQMIPISAALTDLGGLRIGGDKGRELSRFDLINFYGPPDTIKNLPIYRTVSDTPAELSAALSDKVVLVGFHGADESKKKTKDEFLTSASWGPMYGVEVHATIVGNLLQGEWLSRQDPAKSALITMLLVSGIALAMLRCRTILGAISIGFGAALAYTALSFYLFKTHLFFAPGLASIWLSLALMVATSGLYLLFTRGRVISFFVQMTRIDLSRSQATGGPWFVRGPLLAGLTISVVSFLYAFSPYETDARNLLLRSYFYLRGPFPTDNAPVIASISNETLTNLGVHPTKPFPVRRIIEALNALKTLSPRMIIIDGGLVADPADPELQADLALALQRSQAVIWNGELPQETSNDVVSDPTTLSLLNKEPAIIAAARSVLDLKLSPSRGWIAELPTGDASVSGRRFLALLNADNSLTAPDSGDLINFYGETGALSRIPFHELLAQAQESTLLSKLTNKIVFIGYESDRRQRGPLRDDRFRVVASDPAMYGVEINATALGNILSSSWLRAKLTNAAYYLLAIIAVGLLPLRSRNGWRSLGIFIVINAAGLAIIYVAALEHNLWIPYSSVLFLTSSLGFLVALWRSQASAARQRQGLSRVYVGATEVSDR